MESPTNDVDKPVIPPEDAAKAYDVLLRCRDIDVGLFATRSNICLVLQGALLALVSRSLDRLGSFEGIGDKVPALVIILLGLLLSWISVQIVRGASFWVSYWEHRLGEIESYVLPSISIFRDHPSKRNDSLLCRLPGHLKYVSCRSAMLRVFICLSVLWMLLFVLVALA